MENYKTFIFPINRDPYSFIEFMENTISPEWGRLPEKEETNLYVFNRLEGDNSLTISFVTSDEKLSIHSVSSSQNLNLSYDQQKDIEESFLSLLENINEDEAFTWHRMESSSMDFTL